jgi:hypothetical protein
LPATRPSWSHDATDVQVRSWLNWDISLRDPLCASKLAFTAACADEHAHRGASLLMRSRLRSKGAALLAAALPYLLNILEPAARPGPADGADARPVVARGLHAPRRLHRRRSVAVPPPADAARDPGREDQGPASRRSREPVRPSGRRLRPAPLSRNRRRLLRPLHSWRDCSRSVWLTGATEPGGELGLTRAFEAPSRCVSPISFTTARNDRGRRRDLPLASPFRPNSSDWLTFWCGLGRCFSIRLRSLRSQNRLVLLSPAAPAMIGLYRLA